MPRLTTERPVGFSFADGKARFEVVVPKTGGRVRRRRTVVAGSEQEALDRFEAFRQEVLDAIRAKPADPPEATTAGAVLVSPVLDETFKREILSAIRSAPLAGQGRPPKEITFGAYLDRHLDAVCGRVKPRTATSYRQYVRNHLRPYFGQTLLSEITMAVVRDFQGHLVAYLSPHGRWKGRPLSVSTMNGCLAVLRLLVRDAYERGLLGALPRGRWPSKRIELLRLEATEDERERFLAAFDDGSGFRRLKRALRPRGKRRGGNRFPGRAKTLRGSWPQGHPATMAAFERFRALRPLYVVGFETGLRRGDLLGLQWSSVDLDQGLIRVTMQKTGRVATIPMSAACEEALRLCHARDRGGAFVFTDGKGRPISEAIFALAFSTAKVLAGISRRLRPHDMRHTFASRLASEAVSLQVISAALGHSTITLTQRYAKPDETSLRQVTVALNRGRRPG